MKKSLWLAGLVVLAAAGGGAWWWKSQDKSGDVQYRSAKIERGNLQASVSASGAVNPVTQVSVGTQVSGQIKELYVDFNSEVKAGQLIAQIDPETFEFRVRQSMADVDAARAAVLTAQANVQASNAAISRAQVEVTEAQRDADRKKDLADKQFIAQSEADRARALVNTTGESLKSAQAQLAVTQAQVKSAQANVAQREAALAQARIDLQRTKITSPVNGIVIKRAIEKGQTVAASLQSPELFVIAQNLSDMQVDASIDEADVSRIRTGQRATFTVDAFPGQTFEGEVRQVRKAAQNVANVVTYVAVVGFTNNAGRLLPGMTANVRVVTDSRENVLKIPNAALRVRIAGVDPANTGASAPTVPAAPASAPQTGRSSFSFFSEAVAQPAGGGGGFAAQRERLISELQLTADQQSKLDAIQTEMRPQFMAMRDMDEAERQGAREKITAEMRSKISAMLTPDQRKKYQEMIANAPPPGAASGGVPRSASPAPGGNRPQAATAAQTPITSSTPNSIAPRADSMPATGQKPSQNSAAGAVGGALPSAPASASMASPTPQGSAPAAAGGGGGGGPLGEFRNRLVSELQLSADQQQKLDALFTETRPKFAAMRGATPEDRPKVRERIMAELRAKINDFLSAEQKTKYAALLSEMGSRASSRGRIYLLDSQGKPVAYNVRLGITDGTFTELMVAPNSPNAEVFKEGASVITGVIGAGSTPAAGARPTGPRMPF
ncbi:efflux RND transporter periplasmic adaptor subunit [Variovorax sp. PCZ-1]|uniref:efflux RND transporter periplasmic adaptor subunit n=1 Tax=Variovorax sp. PCZ-1 TaxID=2835533 RepID=UPI001BCC286F|nr:efflux RND transporter periplasmic adaptor subunit [Variovorax sp. PCZ-1]MBS7806731.1 efflux RND transporter periplasmic adaptor subunit [Variovorax sp. PCZ-1]